MQYRSIREQVDACCNQVGRDPKSVGLLAVSKTVGFSEVRAAIQEGATMFGENRPEQIVQKSQEFPQVQWHFIGNIQSRRIDEIVASSALIHSVFKESHLAKIDAAAERHGKVQAILLEVNVSGEESKSGLAPSEVEAMLAAADAFDNVEVRGFMTMAPRDDFQAAEGTFAGLAALRDRMQTIEFPRHGCMNLSELSMGMSEDWQIAVAHGATMVRIGRAIFSKDFA